MMKQEYNDIRPDVHIFLCYIIWRYVGRGRDVWLTDPLLIQRPVSQQLLARPWY
jgi:hypothetical protein